MKCVKCGVRVRSYGIREKGKETEVDVCDPCVDGGYFAEYDEDDVVEYGER